MASNGTAVSNAAPCATPAGEPEAAPHDARVLLDLLLGAERRRLDQIERRLGEHDHERRDVVRRAEDHSEVLVDAVRLTAERGEELSEALRPEVEHGLRRSIRDNPDVMADALYPVLGPAVRKLVASLFQPEASGAGQPYRVEQLFLIHRETSLVLAHSAMNSSQANDADVVSGMLEAIRSFVQEAFSAPDFDGMQTLTVGDITVWVEWGPQAVLAVVVRGFPPDALREACAETLRRIHLEHADALDRFDGDIAAFESIGPELASSIGALGGDSHPSSARRRRIGAGALLAGVATTIWYASALGDERRWQRLLDGLDATPGIVVVDSTRTGAGSSLTALRDPLAESPDAWLAAPAHDGFDLRANWVPYLSLEPTLILRRVRAAVEPGEDRGATLAGNVLTLPDTVATQRRGPLRARLSMIPGIERIEFLPPDVASGSITDGAS